MKNGILVLIVIAVIGVGGFLILKDNDDSSESANQAQTSSNEAQTSQDEQKPTTEANTITYTDDGFSPESLNVKSGTTIMVRNNSSRTLDFASNEHPTHKINPDMNIGIIEPGESKTFTISAGAWSYHDHLNPGATGTLTAE